jgi:DNA-binding NtrC family response regulator
MIVDDESTIRQLLTIILEDMGHEVVDQCGDGEEALERYLETDEKPDLMIIDHRMPRMSGVELTERIIEMDPDQNILFLTADESVRGSVLEMGVDNFLEKPADIDTIRESIRKALG